MTSTTIIKNVVSEKARMPARGWLGHARLDVGLAQDLFPLYLDFPLFHSRTD